MRSLSLFGCGNSANADLRSTPKEPFCYAVFAIASSYPETTRMYNAQFAILDLFSAPRLSGIDVCGAGELPPLPDYLSSAIWHHIYGMVHKIPAARHLDLIFLSERKPHSESNAGRACLPKYIDGVEGGDQRLGTFMMPSCALSNVLSPFGKRRYYSIKWSTRYLIFSGSAPPFIPGALPAIWLGLQAQLRCQAFRY